VVPVQKILVAGSSVVSQTIGAIDMHRPRANGSYPQDSDPCMIHIPLLER